MLSRMDPPSLSYALDGALHGFPPRLQWLRIQDQQSKLSDGSWMEVQRSQQNASTSSSPRARADNHHFAQA